MDGPLLSQRLPARVERRPTRSIAVRSGESGFATVFVLILAVGACILLTATMQLHYRVHDQVRRDLRTVQTRAQALHPAAPAPQKERKATP